MPDWYPRLRNAQIHLAEVWIMVFQAKAAVWGIPTANVTDLTGALSSAKREAVRRFIVECAVTWGIGWASHEEIDAINILQASLLAMNRAFEAMLLARKGPLSLITAADIEAAIVDGNFMPDISVPCRALVKADSSLCRKSWPPQF